MIATVFPSVAAQISDAAIHELVNAQLAVLALLVLLAFVVFLGRPLVTRRDKSEDGQRDVLKALIDQNAAASADNRRMIEVVAVGQADIKALNGLLSSISASNDAIAEALKQRARHDDDALRGLETTIKQVSALSTSVTEGRKEAVKEVKDHMDDNARTVEERFTALEKDMKELKEMVARLLRLLEPKPQAMTVTPVVTLPEPKPVPPVPPSPEPKPKED